MADLSYWDIALLAVAGFLAVVALVRLMARHRDQLVERLGREAQQQHRRKQAEARHAERPAAGRK